MMSKFMQIEMTPATGGRGGFFHVDAGFLLDNFKAPFCGIEVKIDTGCSISTIPLRRLKVSDSLCRILKGADIMEDIPYYLSYGVETGELKHAVPVTDGQKMDCPAMKFVHGVSDSTIGGVPVSCSSICLNYDRKGNILIGMDILREWDVHIGISKVTGKNLFLACPSGNMCQDYLDALKLNFGF